MEAYPPHIQDGEHKDKAPPPPPALTEAIDDSFLLSEGGAGERTLGHEEPVCTGHQLEYVLDMPFGKKKERERKKRRKKRERDTTCSIESKRDRC